MYGDQTRNVIGFPDQLVSDAEKASIEYGLLVGRAIESEWFRKEGGTSRFYNNRDTYHKLGLMLWENSLYKNTKMN